jgi:hypothetical protein
VTYNAPQGYQDPFAGGTSVPAVSFKNAPVGATVILEVTERPELVQSRDYETNQPAFWPDGNPKMSAVVKGTVNGELRSVWAQKPSSLFTAIKQAQEQAGAAIEPGGVLTVQFIGEEPTDNPRKAPRKLYSATYRPPAVAAAFAGPAPQQQATPPTWAQQPAAAPAASQQGMTTDPALLAQQLAAMQGQQQPVAAPAAAGGWSPTQTDEAPF